MATEEAEWIRIQKKTFTRWMNSHLKRRGLAVETDLFTDLKDGLLLVNLVEIIGAESLKVVMGRKINTKPRMVMQEMENLNLAVEYIKSKGHELVNIGSGDINKGNGKIILGLMWTLILRFSVAELDGKKGLLLWCQRSTKDNDDVNITNFTSSWTDGKSFCALINRYRPDLLDYATLEGKSPSECLELAFSIAEEKLGIDRLLDVEDLVGNPAPDEKSIIAYVIEYWKLFSKGQANEALIKIILDKLRIANKQKEMSEKYNFDAAALLNWIAEKKLAFGDVSFPNNTDSLLGVLGEYNEYSRSEKPAKSAVLVNLESLFGQINSTARTHGLKAFVPADGHDIDAVKGQWGALNEAESIYRDAALAKYEQFLAYDYNARLFKGKVSRVNAWVSENAAVFEANETGVSVEECQAKLDQHAVFESNLAEYNGVAGELEIIAGKVAAEHSESAAVTGALEAVKASLVNLGESGTVYNSNVLLALEEAKKLIALQKTYYIKAESTDFKLDALEETIAVPVLEGSEDGLNELATLLAGKFVADVAEAESSVAELKSMAETLIAGGKTVSRDAADFETRLAALASKLNARNMSVAMKLGVVQKEESIKATFAEAATVAIKLGFDTSSKTAAVAGELEEQMAALQTIKAEWAESAPDTLAAATAAWDAMQSAHILVCKNTSATIDSLQAGYKAVEDGFSSSEANIASLTAERDGASAESAAQLAEIREVFNFFDEDKDNVLNESEFPQACEGLGLIIDEEEVLAYYKSAADTEKGGLNFDYFTKFVLDHNASGSGKEDVVNAFSTLSKSTVITEEVIKTTFPEDSELIFAALKEFTIPEGFDYNSYVNSIFE